MTNNSIHDIASNLALSFPPMYGERIEHLYPNVRITIERITPEVASKMLESNIKNRKLKREPIERALLSGKWKLNGATIVFDENNCLTDGQHRLTACVKTNIPITTLVVRGIPRESQITMDTGVRRKLDDYLTMDGFKNASMVGAIGVGLIYLDEFGLESAFSRQGSNIFTVEECYEFITRQYDLRIEPIVLSVMRIQRKFTGTVVPSRMLGMVFDQFRKAGDDNLDEFVGQLYGDRAACVSVRLLGDKLVDIINEREPEKRPSQKTTAALIIKAWNAYMRGDDIKQLKFAGGGARPERFPKVFLGYE